MAYWAPAFIVATICIWAASIESVVKAASRQRTVEHHALMDRLLDIKSELDELVTRVDMVETNTRPPFNSSDWD